MINPKLIPRFNIDYDLNDFLTNLFPAISNSNNELKSIFGNKSFIFANSGRSSLYIILKSLDIPKGSKIGVPLYSCLVVFDAIVKAGFIPEFIDINLENYTIDYLDLENKNFKALIVIHTFGRPADIDEIKKRVGDIPIIEDCAHSLFSEYKGKMTGTLGTASFFSFKKYTSTGEGGMIILNDSSFEENLKETMCDLSSSSRIDEVKHAFLTYAHSFLYHKPWYGTISFPVGSKILNTNVNRGFEAKLIRSGDMAVFMQKMIDIRSKIERQRDLSALLIEELKNTSFVLPYESKGTICNYFLFPLRMKDKKTRNRVHVNLRKYGIDSAKLYSDTPSISKKVFGYIGTCPNAEALSDTVLTIPNYYTLNESDLFKIVNALNKIEEVI